MGDRVASLSLTQSVVMPAVVVVSELLMVEESAAAVLPLSVAKPPEELVASTTLVAFADKLASNVVDASVAFAPLVLAQSTLDRASPAVVQSVAKVATSALA